MTPGEKYSKVLTIRRKKAYKAEDECGFGRNTLSNAIKEDREMSGVYHNKFMTVYEVNPEWWKTGEGEEILKNITPVQELDDNKEKIDMEDPREVYRRMIEGDTEYLLIPRTALEGKYRLMALEQISINEKELERRNDELIRKDHQIEQLYELFKLMASGSTTAQLPKIETTKKDMSV